MIYRFRHFFILATLLYLVACGSDDPQAIRNYNDLVPLGFDQVPLFADNAYTPSRSQLGRMLFYDPILSRDSTVACASCHKPQFAFADNLPKSMGINGLLTHRNTPSIANVVYQNALMTEGSLNTLEKQILVPIQEHNEFDFNMPAIVLRLQKHSTYPRLSRKAYDREPDAYVVTRAIANFERTLFSGNAKYDRVLRGKDFFTVEEQSGHDIFFGTWAQCSTCHRGSIFTDMQYHNNGLYDVYQDSGRIHFTGLESDRALFKTPSLRNLLYTAPYMHDGSLQSIEDVVEHYSTGVIFHPQKSKYVKPLMLSQEQKKALVAFLKTLTDHEFVKNYN